jgi:hypothetical protein
MRQLNECGCGCGGNGSCNDKDGNYMFFENLKTIKKYVDTMLQMDPNQVDELLSNGHGWAVDHIATSKDDVQEVGDFLMNEMQQGNKMDSYNMQQPQFVPVSFNNHEDMKNFIREIIRKVKDGYRLYSHKGKNLGTFDTLDGAKKHEREVQYFKHRG